MGSQCPQLACRMSKVIYKQQLKVTSLQEIIIPDDASFRHFDVQHGIPCIWFECDPNANVDSTKLTIRMFYTGERQPEIPGIDLFYIGTVLLEDERLVVHYYYEA